MINARPPGAWTSAADWESIEATVGRVSRGDLHWSAEYVGLPWAEKGDTREGVSCWGLVRLVYAERLGIVLPSYEGDFACSAERAEIKAVIARATSVGPWHAIELAQAREHDVAVFRIGGIDTHVGLICGRGLMLSVSRHHDSEVARIDAPRWSSRFSGLYRHEALMGAARAA